MFTYFFTTLQGQQWILPCGMGWREGELKTWTNIFVIFVRLGWVKLGSWGELEIGRNNRNLIEISRATEPGCLRQNRKQTRETKAYLSSKRKKSEKKNKRKLKKWIRRRKKEDEKEDGKEKQTERKDIILHPRLKDSSPCQACAEAAGSRAVQVFICAMVVHNRFRISLNKRQR